MSNQNLKILSLQCLYCDLTSSRQQGLSAHIRVGHSDKWKAYLKARQNGITISHPTIGAEINNNANFNPKEHLQAACNEIEARCITIRLDLARIHSLQEELHNLEMQNTAIQEALKSFNSGLKTKAIGAD